MKILVVDDVGYTRHFHVRLLQKMNHEVVSAGDGAAALKILENDLAIEVVLTDLMMREMDGVELFRAAQKISRLTDAGALEPPKFILMTALRPGTPSQQRDLEKLRLAKEIGFAEVLFKPIENELLIKTLEAIRATQDQPAGLDLQSLLRRVEDITNRVLATKNESLAQEFLQMLRGEVTRLESALTPTAGGEGAIPWQRGEVASRS